MAKPILIINLVAAALVVTGCSGEGGEGTDRSGIDDSGGTSPRLAGDGALATAPQPGGSGESGATSPSLSGDGQPASGEFGGGSVLVTEAEVDAMRNQACTGWSAEPERGGASLFLVVDASSSMDETANGTGGRSKWVVTRDALVQTVEALPGETAVGLLGYPNREIEPGPSPDHSACVKLDGLVPLGLLGVDGVRQAVIEGLNAIETETCTPTHDAYVVAVEEYRRSAAAGQRHILLMTDGTPTLLLGCGPGSWCTAKNAAGSDREIITEIGRARELGIKTFVLGSPGSELHSETGEDNRPWLSEAAEAGGTAAANCTHAGPNYCHFDMTAAADFGAALRDALATIAGSVVACDYGLPAPPAGMQIDSGAINLVVSTSDGSILKLLRAADGACTEGWYYDEAVERVVLCSQSCTLAQSDPGLSLEVMFGCASEEIVR